MTGHGLVFVTTAAGSAVAVDVGSGSEQWTYGVGGFSTTTPAVGTDRLFATAHWPNTIAVVEPRSGDEQWSTEIGGQRVSSPVLDGGRVLVGSDTSLVSVDVATGRIRTRVDVGDPGFLRTPPTVAGDRVFVTTTFGALAAVDLRREAIEW